MRIEGDFFNSQPHGVAKMTTHFELDLRKDKNSEPQKLGLNYRSGTILYHGETEYGMKKGKGVMIFKWFHQINKNLADKCGLIN